MPEEKNSSSSSFFDSLTSCCLPKPASLPSWLTTSLLTTAMFLLTVVPVTFMENQSTRIVYCFVATPLVGFVFVVLIQTIFARTFEEMGLSSTRFLYVLYRNLYSHNKSMQHNLHSSPHQNVVVGDTSAITTTQAQTQTQTQTQNTTNIAIDNDISTTSQQFQDEVEDEIAAHIIDLLPHRASSSSSTTATTSLEQHKKLSAFGPISPDDDVDTLLDAFHVESVHSDIAVMQLRTRAMIRGFVNALRSCNSVAVASRRLYDSSSSRSRSRQQHEISIPPINNNNNNDNSQQQQEQEMENPVDSHFNSNENNNIVTSPIQVAPEQHSLYRPSHQHHHHHHDQEQSTSPNRRRTHHHHQHDHKQQQQQHSDVEEEEEPELQMEEEPVVGSNVNSRARSVEHTTIVNKNKNDPFYDEEEVKDKQGKPSASASPRPRQAASTQNNNNNESAIKNDPFEDDNNNNNHLIVSLGTQKALSPVRNPSNKNENNQQEQEKEPSASPSPKRTTTNNNNASAATASVDNNNNANISNVANRATDSTINASSLAAVENWKKDQNKTTIAMRDPSQQSSVSHQYASLSALRQHRGLSTGSVASTGTTTSQADLTAVLSLLRYQRGRRFPGDNHNICFFIARSKNQNVIAFEAKLDRVGELDISNTIDNYWLDVDPMFQAANRNKGKFGDRSELTVHERNLAYGCSTQFEPSAAASSTSSALENLKQSPEFTVRFVALPTRPMKLSLLSRYTKFSDQGSPFFRNSIPVLRCTIAGEDNCIAEKLFLHCTTPVEGGVTRVSRIDLHGFREDTLESVVEIMQS